MAVNEAALGALKGELLTGAKHALLFVNMAIGDQLGLYAVLGAHGGLSAAELAAHAGVNERYVEDWLLNQTVCGLVTRTGEDGAAGTGTYSLSPEQRAVLDSPGGPHDMLGTVEAISGVACNVDAIAAHVRAGTGLAWADQSPHIHNGARRFFAPLYVHLLVQQIIPAVDGLQGRLEQGCAVLDVGCGHGVSTRTMGAAFPSSTFLGVDYHAGSIDVARAANTLDNVSFSTENASSATGLYDLITVFDCFHDMADPEAAALNFRTLLKDGGSVLLIEPMAGETIGENANLIGQTYSGFSVTACLQCAMAAEGGSKLGTMAPTARHRAIFTAAGYSSFSVVSVPAAAMNRVFHVLK